jgi:hypothetical protein
VDELVTEPSKRNSGISVPRWLNTVFALPTFGLPGLSADSVIFASDGTVDTLNVVVFIVFRIDYSPLVYFIVSS